MRVPAKVNLALNVGATDNEGYHALGTLFQAVSLFDDLVARPAEAGVFQAERGRSGLPLRCTCSLYPFLPSHSSRSALRQAESAHRSPMVFGLKSSPNGRFSLQMHHSVRVRKGEKDRAGFWSGWQRQHQVARRNLSCPASI